MELKIWLSIQKKDLDKKIRNYPKFRFLLLLSTILAFFISVFWLWQKTFSLKLELLDKGTIDLINRFKTPLLMVFFSLLTRLGSGFFILLGFLLLAVFLIKKKRKKAAIVALLSLVGSAAFVFLLKDFFGRSRPFGCPSHEDCFSFPSGHATMSFYFYGLLDYLIFRFVPISFRKFLVVSLGLITLVLLIALSRLFLGLHYLSDIFAGFFLGGTWLFLAILLIDIFYHRE